MKIKSVKTNIFKEGQDLAVFIKKYIPSVKENSIIAVSSKIAALAESRLAACSTDKEFEAAVKKESDYFVKTKLCYFTIKDGMVMTNAGVDRSNIGGGIVFLPKNPYKTAAVLRKALRKIYGVKKLGVIITDSMILPLRAGVMAGAVGYSGFKGVKNYIGKKDICGREFKTTMVNIADTLASSAAMMMGEGREKTPLVIIEDAPVVFTDKDTSKEMKYPLKDDLYYPFFKSFLK